MAKEIRLRKLVRRDDVAAVLAAVVGWRGRRRRRERPAPDRSGRSTGRRASGHRTRRDAAGHRHRPPRRGDRCRADRPRRAWSTSGASSPTRSSTCTARSTSCTPSARSSPRRRTARTSPPAPCGRRPGTSRSTPHTWSSTWTDRTVVASRRPEAGDPHPEDLARRCGSSPTTTGRCWWRRWRSGVTQRGRDRAAPARGRVRGRRPQAHRRGGGAVRGRPRTRPRGGAPGEGRRRARGGTAPAAGPAAHRAGPGSGRPSRSGR